MIRRLARRLGFVVAAVALFAVPVRPLLACTMVDATPDAMAIADAGNSQHAGHGASHDAVPLAPRDGTPHDDRCPDIAGCAVTALPTTTAEPALPPAASLAPRALDVSALDAPPLFVEPPPPKR